MPSRKIVTRRVLRVFLGMASAGALALTVLAGTATVAVTTLQENVQQVDISDQVGQRTVDYGDLADGSLNILMMGSDKRTGKGNGGHGYFLGERSDTTMLLHLYPDRKSALIVSIPRDTITDIPACKSATGATVYGGRDRFNAAYFLGGPGCTIKTVEAMSGLRIDHFVVLDFNGFKRAISALGGVEVCLNHPIDDPSSNIHLPAGRSRISGAVALDFVRVRHGVGDGSDISRIGRQQLFVTSMIQEITGSGMITDPMRLWHFLDESTKSIKTDKGLADPRGLIALAGSLASLKPENIAFTTLPWYGNPDGATVSEDKTRSAPIWEAMAKEKVWPPPPSKGADGKRLTVRPTAIKVRVRNGNGTAGMGSRASAALAAQGFHAWADDRMSQREDTTIRYSPDAYEAARTLQAALPGSQLREDPALGSILELRLGSSYDGVEALNVRPPKKADAPTSEAITTADESICTG